MSLEERLAELERRLAALELARDGNGPANGSAAPEGWALRGLHEEFADERNGGVMFAGSGRLPSDEQFGWQVQFSTDDIVAYDWDDAAECLAALGSPVRLRILREIIRGSRTAAELTDLDEVGTSGQIYHHLRQLAATGWLHTVGRGRFEVPPNRVVPLLVALATARR
ncbi:winged helix-turn-helix domain-containing protein [Nocardia sp. NBC_00565]|uniref:ArsR/SmtB family transcription factor n=1 Tax=Nocardia sp. NBC_00565 TaxID=2975993 RepID=UPI002E7FC347|nr:winged helix-turn-helix domain-containing protein [Nocardia sp. NBC_00565]WUC00435.1 winged helix-turn-helix domain-containing protein [Nocardia sp. NBC_00565]